MPSQVLISQHALSRARERITQFSKAPNSTLRTHLAFLFKESLPWGKSHGNDTLMITQPSLNDTTFILATTITSTGQIVVKTILTMAQALANQQMQHRIKSNRHSQMLAKKHQRMERERKSRLKRRKRQTIKMQQSDIDTSQ